MRVSRRAHAKVARSGVRRAKEEAICRGRRNSLRAACLHACTKALPRICDPRITTCARIRGADCLIDQNLESATAPSAPASEIKTCHATEREGELNEEKTRSAPMSCCSLRWPTYGLKLSTRGPKRSKEDGRRGAMSEEGRRASSACFAIQPSGGFACRAADRSLTLGSRARHRD